MKIVEYSKQIPIKMPQIEAKKLNKIDADIKL